MSATATCTLRREPLPLKWVADAESLEAELEFPPDGIWFAGHFPGVPILPGVAQLFFARTFARKAFGDFPDAGLYRRIKFRRLVRPGELVSLKVARKGEGAFSFMMSVGGAIASSGIVERADCAVGGDDAQYAVGKERGSTMPPSALCDLLPHRPPMTMLTEVLAVGDGVSEAIADTSPESVFYDSEAGGVPACVALEYMAQTMAIVVGEARRRRGEVPRVGFVLGTRRMMVGEPVFRRGRRYRVAAKCVYVDEEFGAFDCTMAGPDGKLVAKASLTAYQPPDSMLEAGEVTLRSKSGWEANGQ